MSLLGKYALEQGDLASAHRLLSECHQINQEAGNQRNIAHSLFLLANVHALQGDAAQASMLYQQSLLLAQSLRHTKLIASCLLGLAITMTAQGQPVRSGRLWGAAEQVMRDCLALLPQALRPVVEQAWISLSAQLGNDGLRKALTEGKSMEPAQILAAQEPQPIRTLPETTLSPTSSIVPSSTRKSRTYPAGLTTREVEVLRLVAQGLSDAQVAEQLVVSPRTVTTHLTSIYNKLGVNSRVVAARFAVEHQLV